MTSTGAIRKRCERDPNRARCRRVTTPDLFFQSFSECRSRDSCFPSWSDRNHGISMRAREKCTPRERRYRLNPRISRSCRNSAVKKLPRVPSGCSPRRSHRLDRGSRCGRSRAATSFRFGTKMWPVSRRFVSTQDFCPFSPTPLDLCAPLSGGLTYATATQSCTRAKFSGADR